MPSFKVLTGRWCCDEDHYRNMCRNFLGVGYSNTESGFGKGKPGNIREYITIFTITCYLFA